MGVKVSDGCPSNGCLSAELTPLGGRVQAGVWGGVRTPKRALLGGVMSGTATGAAGAVGGLGLGPGILLVARAGLGLGLLLVARAGLGLGLLLVTRAGLGLGLLFVTRAGLSLGLLLVFRTGLGLGPLSYGPGLAGSGSFACGPGRWVWVPSLVARLAAYALPIKWKWRPEAVYPGVRHRNAGCCLFFIVIQRVA